MSIIFRKRRQLSHPYIRLGLNSRFVKTYLEQKTTFERVVEVICKVCGGYENAVKLFHLLKYYVLYGILCLCHATAANVFTL